MKSTSSPALRNCGIEAVDLLGGPGVEGHVAARDVLGGAVVDHHVGRPAGGEADAIGHPAALVGDQVRPAHADVLGADHVQGQVVEPVLIGFAVGVGVDDDLALGGVHADVAGEGQAHVLLGDDAQRRPAFELLEDRLRVVGGAIIDEDDLEVGVAQPLHRAQAGLDGAGAVVGADDHAASSAALHRPSAARGRGCA